MLDRVVRTVITPAWACWERSPYLRHAQRLRQTQYDSPDVIAQRQLKMLQSLIAHAYDTSAFWRARLDAAGLPGGETRSADELRRIPPLTKNDLRAYGALMCSNAHQAQSLHHKKTSGSTGVSVEVLVDDAAQQFKRACALRSNEWSGWRQGERVAALWGNPEYLKRGWKGWLRNRLLDRITFLDTLKMNESAMDRFADTLRRKPPSLLFGHAHSLYLFAEFCRQRGGAGFRPNGIISTAMVLHDWERLAIEQVFATPVTNRYGCEELSLIASECEQHNGLHINADGVYVETLRTNGTPCAPGEVGAIVVTDLVNRAMPLIRYQVGDMGALSDRQCPCGRGLPLLERIEGRIADYVVTPSGDLVSGISLTENFAMLVPGIAQLQIIQEALTQFTFRVVRDAEWGSASERRIAELVAERFGCEVRYCCEFVERIPQEPSGKYRFCISKVPNHFTASAAVDPPIASSFSAPHR